jgi:hypothetical protein
MTQTALIHSSQLTSLIKGMDNMASRAFHHWAGISPMTYRSINNGILPDSVFQ